MFGSRTQGDFNEDSDLDVLVVTDKAVDIELKRKTIRYVLPIEIEYSLGVSTIVRNRNDWYDKFSLTTLFKEIQKDGIVL